MSRQEFKSYEEVHAQLVEAMQEACTKDESSKYRIPDVVPGFIYEEYNSGKKSKMFAGRFSKIAAIFIIILLGMNFAMLNSGSGDVYGDKGLLHRIFEGNRGIYTDNDESGIVEFDESGEVYIITDYSKINDAKKFWNDLAIPQYIPDNFSFNELYITKTISGDYVAEYDYICGTDLLEINIIEHEEGCAYLSKKTDELIELSDRIINMYWDGIYKKYNCEVYFDEKIIYIYGNIEIDEIKKIAINLE